MNNSISLWKDLKDSEREAALKKGFDENVGRYLEYSGQYLTGTGKNLGIFGKLARWARSIIGTFGKRNIRYCRFFRWSHVYCSNTIQNGFGRAYTRNIGILWDLCNPPYMGGYTYPLPLFLNVLNSAETTLGNFMMASAAWISYRDHNDMEALSESLHFFVMISNLEVIMLTCLYHRHILDNLFTYVPSPFEARYHDCYA